MTPDINKGAVAMWVALLRADYAAEGAGFDADLIEALAARVAKAEADRDRLRAALEPFVVVAAGIGWDVLQSDELAHIYGPRLTSGCYIEAGTFHRARAALNPQETEREIQHPQSV